LSGRVTASPLDPRFAAPAAYGALIAAVLALVGVMALLFKSRYSVLLLWIFNILGFIDFLVAVALDSYQFVFAQKAQNIFQFLCKPLVYSR
jgi:hypothetical protein